MNKLKRFIHWPIFILAITGYCVELFSPQPKFILHLGIIGLIYCLYHIVVMMLLRIKFDNILNKGQFLLRVLNFVLLIPFVLLFSFYTLDKMNNVDGEHSPKNLIYQEAYSNDITDKEEATPLFWNLYYHYMDPGNQHMTTSENGRQRAAIVAILGYFLLNGLLVSTLISWFDRRKDKWTKGEVRYNRLLRLKSHYVIIGGSNIIVGIVRQTLKQIDSNHKFIKPYILIQTSRDVESFRRELFSSLTPREQQRIIIYYGSRDAAEDIADLQVGSAKEVYLIGEETRSDDVESYHDTINMRSMALINASFETTLRRKLIAYYSAWADSTNQQRTKAWLKRRCEALKLTCRVMFEYQTTFNIVQVTDINMECIKFLPFNYYEMWAQHVLVCQKLISDNNNDTDDYKPLEGIEGIKPTDDTFVHLVIVGMSRMGTAMAIEAAHLAHYPNFDINKRRTRITFIDEAMEREKHFFMGRFKELFAVSRYRYVESAIENMYDDLSTYPWRDPMEAKESEYKSSYLGNDFIDVEWEFINSSVENPEVQNYLASAANNPHTKLTIAICIPENSRAIAAASYMPDSVYESKNMLQVLVYQRKNNDLLKQIGQNNKRYHNKLRAFGMAAECYDSSLVTISEFIGGKMDGWYNTYYNYQPSGKAKSAKMWSNTYNVLSMWTRFRCFDIDPRRDKAFGDSILEAVGKVEHNRWVVEQLLLRYRPLKFEEQKMASADASNRVKNDLKKVYAHLDICSNEVLAKIDPNVVKLDKYLTKYLPSAYMEYLESKQQNNNN